MTTQLTKQSQTWRLVNENIANMTHGRKAFAASAMNGKIYAMGGSVPPKGYGSTSVEVYDPATKAWSDAPPMSTPRYIFAATALNGAIFVTGNYDEATHEPSTSGEALSATDKASVVMA